MLITGLTIVTASVPALAQNCDTALAPALKDMSEQAKVLTDEQKVLDAYTKSYNEAVAAKKDTYADAIRMRMLTFSGCEQLRLTKDMVISVSRTMQSSTCSSKPKAARDQIAGNARIMMDSHAQCLKGLDEIKSGIAQMKAEGRQ